MKELHDFHARMFNYFLQKTNNKKIGITEITNWQPHTPYHRVLLYDKIPVSQTTGIFTLFSKEFLKQFSNIVEIGSYNGGLSSYLFDTKPEDAFFTSYDIDPTINIAAQRRPEIDFRIGDCFEKQYYEEIVEYINRPGKTLLICDGGNKEREFNEFSKHLKQNDIIILHDFQQDAAFFEEAQNFWQWPYFAEAHFAAIKNAVEENGLDEYESEVFNFHFWGSYVKK